jgi:hypothetical protein
MTPQESREFFIDSLFSSAELKELKENGLFNCYVEGDISIDVIYSAMRDQGV